MREIFFRGKKTYDHEWIEGYYCRYETTQIGGGVNEMHRIVPYFASALYGFEVDPATVGQYTGLTDKNGKKIFEGDIIKHYYSINRKLFTIGQVIFDDEKCKFINRCPVDAGEWEMQRGCVYEVIGNIHDNPELIGKVHE